MSDENAGGFGIFGFGGIDDAIGQHDKVDVDVTAQGVNFKVRCQGCPSGLSILYPYVDIIALKYGISPHMAYARRPDITQTPSAWEYLPNEATWRPSALRCTKCGWHVALRLRQSEPEAFLKQARAMKYIHAAGEESISRFLDSMLHPQPVQPQPVRRR